MLEEIRRFFDEQRGPPPKWPEHLPAISPITGEDLRAESEKHGGSRWNVSTNSNAESCFCMTPAEKVLERSVFSTT